MILELYSISSASISRDGKKERTSQHQGVYDVNVLWAKVH